MDTNERERPVRLTWDGEVESYDWQTTQWILDKSRDQREFITLMPPFSDYEVSSGLAKSIGANAIVHQIKHLVDNLAFANAIGADDTAQTLAYNFYVFANHAGFEMYANDFFTALAFPINSEISTNSNIPDDFTETYWKWLMCEIYCKMDNDGSLSYANWKALLGVLFDASDNVSAGFTRRVFIWLGRKALTNLARLRIPEYVYDPSVECTCT